MTSVPWGSTLVTSRPSVSPPTDSRMRSNRPRSCVDVGDDVIGTKLAKPLRSRRAAADQRCHLRTTQMSQLDGKAADPTRGPRHEDSATQDRWSHSEHAQGCQAGRWQRRRLGEGDAIGQLGDPPLRDRHLLGPGPAPPDADHPGAGSQAVLDVGPQDAGEVPSGTPAIGSRPEHPHLAPIDRERTHLHEHLTGCRHRLGNVRKAILPGAELSATSARMGRALRSSLPSSRRSYVRALSAIR